MKTEMIQGKLRHGVAVWGVAAVLGLAVTPLLHCSTPRAPESATPGERETPKTTTPELPADVEPQEEAEQDPGRPAPPAMAAAVEPAAPAPPALEPAPAPAAEEAKTKDESGQAQGLGLVGIGEGGGGTLSGASVAHGAGVGSAQGFGAGHGRLGGSHKSAAPMLRAGRAVVQEMNTESYAAVSEDGFTAVSVDPRSTFSIDVDTASLALVRRHLNEGALPPKGAVRIEEMVNYFGYSYPEPAPGQPFSVTSEVGPAPWNTSHQLLRLGIKARHIDVEHRPAANLVFLVDVSGSMEAEDKLPLLKRGLSLLVEQLRPNDRVSLVVYAGASGLVLPPTPGSRRPEIVSALERLQAGGSTNGASGIELAYAQARAAFIPGGTNRVILATDGDFNVGVTSESALVDLIRKKAKERIFLSVLGFGSGNYQDSTLERLADEGNGNYGYVDSLSEARKVLVEQAAGTLITVAKDVKIQVEFNPNQIAGFRLIGYENRKLAHADFNDDRKDAGEIGADHTVTALYELVPRGLAVPGVGADTLRYQKTPEPSAAATSPELLTVGLRYKAPEGDHSHKLSHTVPALVRPLGETSSDFRFAASVAAFGMLLRESEHKGKATYATALELARGAQAGDPRRQELVGLLERAKSL